MSIKGEHVQGDILPVIHWCRGWCQWLVSFLGLKILTSFKRCNQVFSDTLYSRQTHAVMSTELTICDSLVPGMNGLKDPIGTSLRK